MPEGRLGLERVRLFSDLSGPDLDAIARLARTVEVQAGDTLCQQGQPGFDFYVIIDGEAVVEQSGRQIARLGPGDHFGELALLDRGPRAATVAAATDMRLLTISELDFTALIDELPAFAHNLLAALAGMVREAELGK